MRYFALFLFSTLLFFNCKTSENEVKRQNQTSQIISSWRLAEIVTLDKDTPEIDEMLDKSVKRALISNGLVLYFFPDSSYTELDGYQTSHGMWQSIGDSKIQFDDKILTIDKIEKKGRNNFLLVSIYNKEDNLNSVLKFVEDGASLKNFKNDPFYKSNNLWRQKPTEKETDEQIRARLLNYILHYANILQASLERESSTVSFIHSMGLIQVFRGGIGRIPKNKINQEWINCFYDEEDAMKAFYFFSGYLKKGIYKGGTTGDWIKDDYDILMNLYDQIQKDI